MQDKTAGLICSSCDQPKVVADMIGAVGVNRVPVDLHAEQIQGFFSIPVDNVYGSPVLTDDIERQNHSNLTVVS